jgi:hypothetical protein
MVLATLTAAMAVNPPTDHETYEDATAFHGFFNTLLLKVHHSQICINHQPLAKSSPVVSLNLISLPKIKLLYKGKPASMLPFL